MSVFNPWILLAILLAMGTSGAVGWKARGDHEKAKQLETALAYAELVRDEQDRSAKVAADAERDLAKVRASAKRREAGLRKELNNAIYSACVVPESGRMLYNAAVRDARSAATGQPVEPVRDAGPLPPPATMGDLLRAGINNADLLAECARKQRGLVAAWPRSYEGNDCNKP